MFASIRHSHSHNICSWKKFSSVISALCFLLRSPSGCRPRNLSQAGVKPTFEHKVRQVADFPSKVLGKEKMLVWPRSTAKHAKRPGVP